MFSFISYLYTNYINVIVLLITFVGIFYLFKNPLYTFYIIVFTLPFKSFYIWVLGTNIEAWKILSGVSLVLYAPSLLIRGYNKIRNNKYFNQLILYCGYSIFLTILFSFIIPSYEKHTVEGGFFKNEGRFIFQIILFLITINLALLPIYVIKKDEEIIKIFKIYLYSTIALSILGIIQETVLLIFGQDLFPIHRPGGVFDYTGGLIYTLERLEHTHRMNSLAGEPKHLAIALCIGIAVVLPYRLNGVKIIKNDLFVLAMFISCLIATYSATGYVWFGVIILTIMSLYRFKLSKLVVSFIMVALVSMLILKLFLSDGGEMSPHLVTTYKKINLEIQDQAVLNFFLNNPLYALSGLGLGNIHFYAMEYLPLGFPLFRDTPFKSNSGFFLLLGDVGLFGVLMFTRLSIGLIKSTQKLVKNKIGDKIKYKIIIDFMIIAFILFWLRYYEFFFVTLGLVLYLNNELRHNKNYSK